MESRSGVVPAIVWFLADPSDINQFLPPTRIILAE
jgi:hypothetical protein